jgi:hypothetical protein
VANLGSVWFQGQLGCCGSVQKILGDDGSALDQHVTSISSLHSDVKEI